MFIWQILLACAPILACKTALPGALVELVLNGAANCGGETAAGGLGAGSGALGCDPDGEGRRDGGRTGPGTLADGSVSGVGGAGVGRGTSAYDNWQRYREQLKNPRHQPQESKPGTTQESSAPKKDEYKGSSLKSGSAAPSIDLGLDEPNSDSGTGGAVS